MTAPRYAALGHGIARDPTDVTDLAAHCSAILNALPSGSVVSGVTAAALRGTWLPSRFLGEIEVTMPTTGRMPRQLPHSVRHQISYRRRTVPEDQIEDADGVPAVSAARTWLDLAARLTPPELIAAGDWTLGGPVSSEQLEVLVRNAYRQRGGRAARLCLPLLDGRSASRPESHLRAVLMLNGVSGFEVNADVVQDGWIATPDLVLRSERLALEYNGADHAAPTRMRKDITRVLDLQDYGWTVMVFGPAEVFGRPDQVAARVRRMRLRLAMQRPSR